MASNDKLVQINITRRGKDKFYVTTFNKKECLYSEEMDEKEAGEFVIDTMKRLGLLPAA
jgi:hypothetical protein